MAQFPNPDQNKLARATFVLKCALADLEGFVDKHDPDEDEVYTARKTIIDIKAFLKGREGDAFSDIPCNS